MNFYELLFNRGQPSGEGMTHFERLFAAKLAGGGEIKELEGVPPLLFKANGEPLIDWIIYGNMSQTGTPTPTTPIQPSECGDMSSNLVNIADFTATVEPSSQDKILWTGNLPVGTYTFSINQDNDFTSSLRNTIHLKIDSTSYYENATGNYHNNSGRHTYTFTVSDSTATVTIYYWTNTISNECSFSQAILNSGSTALPYDKYGQYKIPISSAGQTTPVYLGEIESTRRIKKLVLTGEETWYLYSAGNVHQFYTQNMVIGGVASSSAYSTIAPYGMTVDNRNGDYGCYTVSSENEIAFQMYGSKADFPIQANWKTYLAQQYAAGTPVTVWYVLATPVTAVVNEPLMKIGGYADSISKEQAGVEIPTIKGNNTLDIETTLKPSNVYIKYKT